MRFELIIFIIAGFLMANIYTDGKYIKQFYTYKKYYQMAGIAFGALMLYWLVRKNPLQAKQMLSASNDYVKYLPVDRNTANMISPILDFTTKQTMTQNGQGLNYPVVPMNNMSMGSYREKKILQSGKGSTKRSVSETKKKYVAASQNWKCGMCQKQLPAWFEVDHTVRLEHGGSNHIDNLVALCRDCHGQKTAVENL